MFKFIVFFSEQIFIPVTMIILGILMIKRTPAAESGLGYRTKRSLSSERAWLTAHHTLGSIWLVSGIFTLAAAAVITACLGSSGFAYDNSADNFIYGQWAVQYALCAGGFSRDGDLSRKNDESGDVWLTCLNSRGAFNV